MKRRKVIVTGYGLGSLLAAVASWIVNKSVAWMFVHFFCGWIYLLWAVFVHTTALNRALANIVHALG